MPNSITISGIDDCIRCLDKAPDNLLKMSRTAMREAAKPVARQIRQQIPKRWRRLVRSKIVKMQSGNTNALIGLFNGHQQQGHQNPDKGIDDWFKAYWANYGTLKHRDPEHSFEYPIKHATKHINRKGQEVRQRKNENGQPAQKFFEAATNGYEDKFTEAFEQSLKRQEDKLYDR